VFVGSVSAILVGRSKTKAALRVLIGEAAYHGLFRWGLVSGLKVAVLDR